MDCKASWDNLHVGFSLSLLFSRLNNHSSLGLSRWEMLLDLNCLSKDSLWNVHVLPVPGNQNLNTRCQEWPHQCQVQWKDHLPELLTLLYQMEPFCYLCHKDILLVHVQSGVHQVLFCQGTFQLQGPHYILVDWFILPQVQDFALVELHRIPVSPFLLQ